MSFISKILDAFKMESTREMERDADKSNSYREISEAEAISEINRANRLADVANKTSDREEFYKVIGEIENILTELSKYENKFDFSYPPSANLRDLRRGKDKQIELLEKRIAEKEKEAIRVSASVTDSKTEYNNDDYYVRIAGQKENNLKITYADIKCYDLKPFDLSKTFISDGNFTAIELEGENLEKAYQYLQAVHVILMPFRHLFQNVTFPTQIGTGYDFGDSESHLPTSHLRLQPYTVTKKENKYPFCLWLSYSGHYGTEYIYMIYFDQNGEIGKSDLSLHGFNSARISYESKIRRNENGLYVLRISKTLYAEPYGTKILYHYKGNDNFQKNNNDSVEKEVIKESKTDLREKKTEPTKETLESLEDKTKQRIFEYIFPPIHLLDIKQDSENHVGEIEQRKEKLERVFSNFGVNADIVSISHGARFTRFEVQVGKGVRIRDVFKIEDDIKLNLEAAYLHIEPISGRTTIGIDAENKKVAAVTFREMIESKEFREFPSHLAVGIGKDTVGRVIVENLEDMCHLLIGGTTGSGKSVCINSILMSILYKADPNEAKLILIDTKAINLSLYNGIPHLMIPVVSDLRKATAALQWCVAEMMDRYKKFTDFGTRDLAGYNAAVEKGSPNDEPPHKIPRIVIIIDDFSDLMIADNRGTEGSICRLAQMGRAAGIHLIISTQRPSVDVVTGIIKANIPSRIAFNVFSAIDSRTILDEKGAEDLLSNGDMLFYPFGARKPIRVQGTFVSDEELKNVIEFVKNQMIEYYGVDYVSNIEHTQSESELDPYFIEAGKFVIDKDKASIGMIQRVFKIGFNRAARLMDQLAEAGVVGEEEGTKPRRILMSMEEFVKFIEEKST